MLKVVLGAPDSIQTIFRSLFPSSFLDEVLDYIKLGSITRFELARDVKNKAVSCRILEIIFNVPFPALESYAESTTTGE
jgi:hypothetical protein